MQKVILDTNLTVLFVIGSVGKQHICRHKRLSEFTEEDFPLLCNELGRYHAIITTPNILSESSNLIRQMNNPLLTTAMDIFRLQIERMEERYVESNVASKEAKFPVFGLADSTVIALAREQHTVISTDLELVHYLEGIGLRATNFTLLRNRILFS